MPDALESNPPGERIAPGGLGQKIEMVTRSALASGALQPINTKIIHVQDHGIRFTIHQLDSMDRKHKASLAQKRLDAAASKKTNPFLPYDKQLYVGDLTQTHAAVLNKYFVVPGHLLIVTRAFVAQEMLLDEEDLEAAWTCLREIDSLVFYNAGTEAGASQDHRHLQLISLPMGAGKYRFPTEPVLLETLSKKSTEAFPFLFAVEDMSSLSEVARKDPTEAAKKSMEIYWNLVHGLGLGQVEQSRQQAGPYNMLMTRDLMMIVPRSQEHAEGISINSLGFAGSLLVRNSTQLKKLQGIGPMSALEQVSFPNSTDKG